jgi:hypothetical protein
VAVAYTPGNHAGRYRPHLERIGTDWTRPKNRPTFLPTGPYLVPAAFAGDPADMLITLRLGGVVRQHELAKDMIFDLPRLVSRASALVPRDGMEAEITGLGRQRNTCVSERLTAHA